MSQTVEIPDQGIAEFPDEMTPDQIKGVIQQKFYSKQQEIPTLPTQEITPPEEPQPAERAATIGGELEKGNYLRAAEVLANRIGIPKSLEDINPFTGPGSEALTTPVVKFERPPIPEQPTPLRQTLAGLLNLPADVLNFAGTPAGVATMGAVPALPVVAQRGLAAVFGAQGTQQAIEAPSLQEAVPGAAIAVLGTAGAVARPTLSETLGFDKPPVPELPTARELVPEGLQLNASEITKPESVTEPEIRPPVGQEAPLRQQGETPQARQGIEAGQEAAQAPVAPTVPQPEQPVQQGFVRLYHGSSSDSPQAGRDFTTDRQYAEDYAAKAEGGAGGKVWSVDVPEGSLKTHDEYGQPMTRVVVPDEIANQAQPVSESGQSSVTPIQPKESVVTPEGQAAPPEQATTATKPTGIAERYREEEQPGSVIPGAGVTSEEARTYGQDFINKGGDPYMAVRRAQAGNTSWRDVGVARAEYERLGNEKRAAENALEKDPNNPQLQEAFNKADDTQRQWSKNAQPILTRAGDALRAATRAYPREINSFSDFTDIVNDHYHGGVEMTPKVRADLQKAVRGIKDANTEATVARNQVTEIATRKAGGKIMGFEDLKADLRSTVENLLKDCIV